jgi:hypothetical protein
MSFGSFIASWRDEGHWPGNICWLLICYCIGHLALGGSMAWVRGRRLPVDALNLAGLAIGVPLLWFGLLALGVNLGGAALFIYMAQPLLVIAGFALVHRAGVSYR